MKSKLLISLMILCAMAAGAMAAGDWGYSGQSKIDESSHLPHPMKGLSYGEQWSSTMVFENGDRLNVSLSHSNLTTKSDKAQFSVEHEHNGKKVRDSARCSIKVKKDPFTLACGPGVIQGPLDALKISYKGKKIQLLGNISPLRPPFSAGRINAPGNADDFYHFTLMVPRGKAVVKIGETVLQGWAVMDHSYSDVKPHEISRHWIRNTVITDTLSVVFGANMLPDGRTSGWVSVADNNGHGYASKDVTFSLEDYWNDSGKSGYFAPSTIKISGADGFSLVADKLKFKSKRDMLGHLSSMEAFVARRFADPMEYLFVGDAQIAWKAGDAMRNDTVGLAVQIKQMNQN